jgi:hypothetical protein
MKILENIPLKTVAYLRSLGHEVVDIRRTTEEGIDDDTLWKKVQVLQALFITTDKGFAQHRMDSHFGVLIVRLRQPNSNKIHQRVVDMIGRFKPEEWRGMFVVAQDSVHRVSFPSPTS